MVGQISESQIVGGHRCQAKKGYFLSIILMIDSAVVYPEKRRPSENIKAGVPVIPSFFPASIFSSIAFVSHFGFGSSLYSNASSRSFSDFSHTIALDFSYASLCIGRGYIII